MSQLGGLPRAQAEYRRSFGLRENFMDITPYLKLMVDKNASDLFFHVGAPVNIKIGGVVRPIGNKVLGPGQVREIAY